MALNNRKNTNNPKKRAIEDTLQSTTSNPKPRKRRKINEEEKIQHVSRDKNDSYRKFKHKISKQRLNTAVNPLEYPFDETRIRPKGAGAHGIPSTQKKVCGVVYWMSRDQRVQDNWAMIYAQKMAMQHKVPLRVVFCLQSSLPNDRYCDFMIGGLQRLERELYEFDIPFTLLLGSPTQTIPPFAQQNNCNLVVTDFSPLRSAKQWLADVGSELMTMDIHLAQVDARNVVPVWMASNKQEYAARTIRSKINKKLAQYLIEFPSITAHLFNENTMQKYRKTDWKKAQQSLNASVDIPPVEWCKPGTEHGMNELCAFIDARLEMYHKDRNVPTKNAVSNLSPWYHFGHLSAARAALEVEKYKSKYKASVESYLEELIIRRELSDNFCFYNKNYDRVRGASQWAQDSLEVHEADEREYIYDLNELDTYQTHDDLWNAAQKQLVIEAKMHGFLRMYWAKKILEWSETPKEALQRAIYLNDKYSLDGRDPNGYVGCMWSICGIHDQGWKERPIFGKIRYMNYAGCKRKFDVQRFVKEMGVSAVKYSKR